MNNTSFADRLAAYRAKNAAAAASVRYADYCIYRIDNDGLRFVGEVSFPSNTANANFGGVCFYDPATDTFRNNADVDGFFVERVG